MTRGGIITLALVIVAAGLGSCGRMQREQRAAWRDQAEAQCLASRQVQPSSYVSFRSQPIEGPGTCGMTQPLKVSAFAAGRVGLTSPATLSCPIVTTADRWLDEVVQRAAMNVLGAQVIEIRAGSYSCRAMNNGSGTRRTSEHAYGNALDVFSFRLADGRDILVKTGWNGAPAEQAFLREVFLGACDMFSTVLGPGHDIFHYDHFHIDLARHAGGRRICKPKIEKAPSPDLMPPQPDRTNWASARGVAGGTTALALGAGNPPQERGLPPGWAVNGPMSPRQQVAAAPVASAPLAGGPLRLPGSSYMRDEVIEGDLEGKGIVDGAADQPGDGFMPGTPGQEMITPEHDPFAVDALPPRR